MSNSYKQNNRTNEQTSTEKSLWFFERAMPTTLTTLYLCNIPWNNNDVSNVVVDVVGTVDLCKKIQSKSESLWCVCVVYYEMNTVINLPC